MSGSTYESDGTLLVAESRGMWASLGYDDDYYSKAQASLSVRPKGTGAADDDDRQQMKGAETNALPSTIVDNWQALQLSSISEELKKRVTRLASKPDGWKGPGSKRLSSLALGSFLDFWARTAPVREPFVTVAPTGGLYVEWHASWRRHLDIEFTPTSAVLLALIDGESLFEVRSDVGQAVALVTHHPTNPTKWHKR